MKKIALILPYFGKFKNYFPLWVESCKNNPTVDWLLFTDQTFDFEMPLNIHITATSFEEFKTRLQTAFSFPIALQAPYKLCDFKPTYGSALKKDLASYDFWGHCDCDLIFGDIRHFLTEEILTKYDKIFTRGHLTLYRNTDEVNNFFKQQNYKPYQNVFKDAKNCTFDEWAGMSQAWDLSGRPYYDELVYDDIRGGMDGFHTTKENSGWGHPYHRQNDISQAKHYRKMKNIIYDYQGGKLYRTYLYKGKIQKEEVLYVHLQKRDMAIENGLDLNHFFIIPNAFCKPKHLNLSVLKKLSPNKITCNNTWQYIKSVVHSILQR